MEFVAHHRLDGRLDADGEAPAQRRLGGQLLEDLVLHALLGARAGALLLEDDLALAVDLGGLQAQARGHVRHEQHPLVENVPAPAGQGELIRGLVEAREGVLIAPEGEPERLEEGNDGARGEIGAAVEGHVLEIVGEALGGVGLVERAGGDVEPDAHPALGIAVLPDDVAEPIGQGARHEGRIGGQLLLGDGRGPRLDRGHEEESHHQHDERCAHAAS